MAQDKLFGNLFLSVGAMKAGTTWLYSMLAHHPDLHFTPEKEIHYFHYLYGGKHMLSETRRLELAKRRYLEGIDPARANIARTRTNLHWVANYLNSPVDDFWYRNLFTYPRGEKYGCDFSNLYALLPPQAWDHIKANTDTLKVLYTLRHPVKRLWSHVKFHLQVTGELDQLEHWTPSDFASFVKKPFLWDNAEYGACLRVLRGALAEDQLKVVFFEDVRADEAGALHDIERFLDVRHVSLPPARMAQKINASAARPMPEFFPELVAGDVARITREVEELGYTIPQSWRA